MPIHGRLEVLKRSDREHLQELSGVRGFGGEFDEGFYVKSVAEGGDVSPAASARFLDAARVQQRVADSGAKHWAPVLLAGVSEFGPYLVTSYFPRTAADLARNRVRLSAASLRHIMRGVVEGLAELHRAAERAHGNLKPSNVLISGHESLREATVVLSDLAPSENLNRSRNLAQAEDAQRVGQLLHLLVTHRPFTGQWPVVHSAEWSRLGGSGKEWRKLCNRLLHPDPEQRPYRAKALLSEVSRIRSNRPVARAMSSLVIFGLAGGTAAAIYFNWPLARERAAAVARSWSTPAAVPQTRPADVEPVRKEGPEIARTNVGPTPTKETTPPVSLPALGDLRQHAASFRERGWTGPADYLSQLESRLTRAEPGQLPELLREFTDTHSYLSQIDTRLEMIEQNRQTLAAVKDPLLNSYSAMIDQRIAPALAAQGQQSVALLSKALDEARLDGDWAGVIAFVRGPEFEKLDTAYFVEASQAHKAFGQKKVASSADLAAWLAEAGSARFHKLPPTEDPRPRWAVRQQIDSASAEVQKLAALPPAGGAKDTPSAAFQARLSDLQRKAASLTDAKLEWNARNRDAIVMGIKEVDGAVAALAGEVKDTITKRQEAIAAKAAAEAEQRRIAEAMAEQKRREEAARQEQLAREQQAKLESQRKAAEMRKRADDFTNTLGAASVSAVPEIEKAWQSHRDPIVAGVRNDPARLDDPLKRRADAVRALYATLDAEYKATPTAPKVGAISTSWAKPLADALNAEAAQRRQRLLADGLTVANANSAWSPAQLKAEWARLRAPYDQWLASAAQLAADFAAAETLLAAGYMPDEKTADGSTIAQRIERWRDKEPLSSPAVAGALQPVVSQLQRAAETDRAALDRTIADEQAALGVRLAAWRNFSNGNATLDRQQLTRNAELASSLRTAVTKIIADAARRQSIEGSLTQQLRSEWSRFAAAAGRAEDLEWALDQRARFGVTELADARLAFNAALRDLKQALAAQARPEDLKRLAAALQRSAAALPAGQSGRDGRDILALTSDLQAFSSAGGTVDVASLGPAGRRSAALAWQAAHDPAAGTLTYTARLPSTISPDPTLELTFKRVESPSGPFYFCTTEVPVGLFLDTVTALGFWKDMSQLMWMYDARSDPRPGPRTWQWSRVPRGSAARSTVVWLSGATEDHYAPQLADQENRTVLRAGGGESADALNPSRNHPIQYVSPLAAKSFAELLGCRLPTPTEWQAAYKSSGVATGAAGFRPNLRDQAWKLQWHWANQTLATTPYSPDKGIFLPAGVEHSDKPWTPAALAGRDAIGSSRYYDDGALFFRPVASRSSNEFSHLIGNIAEYAADADKVYVIGGSALSVPGPLDKPHEVPNWKENTRGYSDVGLRLAFSAPTPPAQRLAAAVERQQYLLASSAAPAPTTQRTNLDR